MLNTELVADYVIYVIAWMFGKQIKIRLRISKTELL